MEHGESFSETIIDNHIPNKSEKVVDEDHDEIMSVLKSEKAKRLLPYLNLDKLSPDETANLLAFGNYCVTQLDELLEINPDMDLFDLEEGTERLIAEMVGEEDCWNDYETSKKLRQAYKLFCASVQDATDGNYELASKIHRALFSMSPSLVSYCGALNDYFELLTITERDYESPLNRDIRNEIIYQQSFNHQNSFEELMKNSSPTQQLKLLLFYRDFALECSPGTWNERALNRLQRTINTLEDDLKTRPLLRIVANNLNEGINDWFDETKWVYLDESNPEHMELILKDKERRKKAQEEQGLLHQRFPVLPSNQRITVIAPGVAAASFGNYSFNMVADEGGQTASLLEYLDENSFGLDKDSATLIRTAHNPDIKSLINKQIGMDLASIPLDAQIQLLKFMTEADNGRFDKLCHTLHSVNQDLRLKLAENFLAADFGEDFGDSLLTIADSERLSDNEKKKILETIGSCRKSIGKITDLYKGFDGGKFAKEYARAANERLTDAITVFSQIAKKGVIKMDLGWPGKAKFNYDSAIEALGYEARSLEIISGTIEDVQNGEEGAFAEVWLHRNKKMQRENRTVYNFYSPQYGYVLLYTRPEGSHSFDDTVEYGKRRSRYDEDSVNAGVEASISFIVDPVIERDNRGNLPLLSPYRPDPRVVKNENFYDEIRMNKVSAIRLDREGRAPGWSADDPRRDPINSVGMVSVDLAAIGDRKDTPSGKIARLLSVGGMLREKADGAAASLNHNTKWFDQKKYGTSEGFREIVEYIDDLVNGWCEEHGPRKNNRNSIRNMVHQARGRKVAESVA